MGGGCDPFKRIHESDLVGCLSRSRFKEQRRRDSAKSLKFTGGCRIQRVDGSNEETAN